MKGGMGREQDTVYYRGVIMKNKTKNRKQRTIGYYNIGARPGYLYSAFV